MVRLRKLSDRGMAVVLSPEGGKTRVTAVGSHYGAYEFEVETFDQDPDAVRLQAGLQLPSAVYAEVPPLAVIARPENGKPVMVDVGAGLFAAWKSDPEGAVVNIACDMAVPDFLEDDGLCIEAYLAAEASLKAATGVDVNIPFASTTALEFKTWMESLSMSEYPEVREMGIALENECRSRHEFRAADNREEYRPSFH